MPELQDLRRNLAALVEQDRRRRCKEEEACALERRALDAARAGFERAARGWMEEAIARLGMLVEMLPAAGAIEATPAGWKAGLVIPSGAEFPVAASLTVTITPLDRFRAGRVTIEPLLIPMLQGHPQAMVRDFEPGASDASEVGRFLDQGLLDFARAFLHVRDPESPYQAGRRSGREAEVSRPPAPIEEPAITV